MILVSLSQRQASTQVELNESASNPVAGPANESAQLYNRMKEGRIKGQKDGARTCIAIKTRTLRGPSPGPTHLSDQRPLRDQNQIRPPEFVLFHL